MSPVCTSGFENKTHEASNSQSTQGPSCNSSAQHGPIRSATSLDSIDSELLHRTTSKPDAHQTRQSFRRFRCRPIDPTLEQVSATPEEPPRISGQRPKFDVEDVLRKVLPRTECNIKCPEFDAAGSYVESDDAVLKMWHDEARRLMEIANSPDMPLEFKSNGFLQEDTQKGYSQLSKMSQKIMTANAICLLDNECINAEYCGRLSNQQKLSSLIEQVTKSQRAAATIADLENAEGQQQDLHSLPAIYSLVNYVSAVLTRLMTDTSPHSYWHTNVMSILIRRITKMKLLLVDLQTSSSTAVSAGEAICSKLRQSGGMQHLDKKLDMEEECEEYMRTLETEEKEGTASYEEKQIAIHCIEQNKYRIGLNSALRHIFMSLRFTNRSAWGLRAAEYEICALMYQAGLDGFKALIYQDRDLEYSATSSRDNLDTAYSAFSILYRMVMRLDISPEQGECTGHNGTKMDWRYDGGSWTHPRSGTLWLNSMDRVITLLIPLATTNAAFVANFTCFRHVMGLDGFTRANVLSIEDTQFRQFRHMSFRLYTSQLDDIASRRDVLLLSQAIKANVSAQPMLVKARGKTMQQLNKVMHEWVVDEGSVTVSCPGYVWSVMTVAGLLIGGGLGIGFSVGDRVHGVDPSNVATYLWVVAAFMVLIAKNMQVKEWAWNDFLRRRVRCCSVSELSSMTGMDGQLIISKLLHDERRDSVLNVRGPYNSAFLRRSNEGFSIDEPLRSWTLLRTGLVMVKVATARGHALVCLDFRRGTDLSVIGHTPDPQREYLICEQIDNFEVGHSVHAAKSQTYAKHAFSRSKGLKWKRVQGVYWFGEAKFM